MVKKPTAADSVDTQHESYAHCADGCGARVNSAKSTFLQGHDQRLIADLSDRVAVGEMGPFQRALLGLVDDPRPAEGAYTYIESGDIMERINTVSAAVSRRFSDGLANKFASAAMAKWDRSVRQGNLAEARKARAEAKANAPKRTRKPKAEPAPIVDEQPAAVEVETDTTKSTVGQPVQNLRGTEVKVKIGRWTYDATVVGMNQAGKVSAVEYLNKKGEPTTTDRFKLVTN